MKYKLPQPGVTVTQILHVQVTMKVRIYSVASLLLHGICMMPNHGAFYIAMISASVFQHTI